MMIEVITVTYDGKVLTPKTALDLDVNKEYQIQVISQAEKLETKEVNAWDILEDLAGSYYAPEDWSNQHNHYLYGTPKTRDY